MDSILIKGIIRNGRVEVDQPITFPEGSAVKITGWDEVASAPVEDGAMTPAEIAHTLAAMAKVEPFDMTDEDRAGDDAWEKRVQDYSTANMDRGIEDVFP